jgi:hypothetical protein
LLARRSGAYWTLSTNDEVKAEIATGNAAADEVLGVVTRPARAIETKRNLLAALSNMVITPDAPGNMIAAGHPPNTPARGSARVKQCKGSLSPANTYRCLEPCLPVTAPHPIDVEIRDRRRAPMPVMNPILVFFAAFNWCDLVHKGISAPSMSLTTRDQVG